MYIEPTNYKNQEGKILRKCLQNETKFVLKTPQNLEYLKSHFFLFQKFLACMFLPPSPPPHDNLYKETSMHQTTPWKKKNTSTVIHALRLVLHILFIFVHRILTFINSEKNGLLKTLCEKEKILVTSIFFFFFFNNVFCLLQNKYHHLRNISIVFCKIPSIKTGKKFFCVVQG